MDYKIARGALENYPIFSERFRILGELGQGGFGSVFKVESILENKIYAIKCICIDQKKQEVVGRELCTLASLDHPNIVRYYDAWNRDHEYFKSESDSESSDASGGRFSTNGCSFCSYSPPSTLPNRPVRSVSVQNLFSFIRMEFCQSTLREAIENNLHLEDVTVRKLFRNIIDGLKYIHDKKIIHRDLKPENILLQNDVAKIGDFGLATTTVCPCKEGADQQLTERSYTNDIGSPLYSAPEIHSKYDEKIDIYSLGIILFEMCYPKMNTAMERHKTLMKLRMKEINFPNDLIDDCKKTLIKKLLNHDPSKRPSCSNILLNNSFFYKNENILQEDCKQDFKKYVALNLFLEKRIVNFKIHDKVDSLQSYSDIVLHTVDHTKRNKLYLIQIKLYSDPSFEENNLLSENEMKFKIIMSQCEDKEICLNDWTFSVDEINYILITNCNFKQDYLQEVCTDFDVMDLLYKDKINCVKTNAFPNNFIVCLNTDKYLNEIREFLQNKKDIERKTIDIINNILYKRLDIDKGYIAMEHLKSVLFKFNLEVDISVIQNTNFPLVFKTINSFNCSVIKENKIAELLWLTILKEIKTKYKLKDFSEHELGKKISKDDIEKLVEAKIINSTSDDYSQEQFCVNLWLKGEIPIIIQLNSEEDIHTILSALYNTFSKRRIIIVHETDCISKLRAEFEDLSFFDNIQSLPEKLLNENIKFIKQFFETQYKISIEEHLRDISTDVYVSLMLNLQNLSYIAPTAVSYKDRNIYKPLLKNNVVSNRRVDEVTLFIIYHSKIGRKFTQKYAASLWLSLHGADFSPIIIKGPILQTQRLYFEKVHNKMHINIHVLKYVNEECYQWLYSFGDVNLLRKYRTKNSDNVVKDTCILEYFKNPVNLLVGVEGLGKSTLLKYLKNNHNKYVIYLNLKEDVLKETNNFLTDVISIEVDKMICLDNHSHNILKPFLIKVLRAHKDQLIIMIDGIDEIEDSLQKYIIENIEEYKLKTWMTSKSFPVQLKFFSIIPLYMENLRETEKIQLFKEVIFNLNGSEYIKDLDQYTKVIKHYPFVPSQIYILAEVVAYSKNLEKINVIDIFERYIDKYLNRLSGGIKLNRYGLSLLSLKFYFPEYTFEDKNFITFFIDHLQSLNSVNTIGTVNYRNKFIFRNIHIAEYLCANILVEKRDKILIQKLFSSKFKQIKYYFNLIAAKECKLHTAFLIEDYNEFYEFIDIVEKDLFGRTIWHLIAASDNEVFVKYPPTAYNTFSELDVFGMTPVDYAVKSYNLKFLNEFCNNIYFNFPVYNLECTELLLLKSVNENLLNITEKLLHQSIVQNSLRRIKELVISILTSINNSQVKTILDFVKKNYSFMKINVIHEACIHENFHALEYFLDNNYDVDTRNSKNVTPLMLATKLSNFQIVELLLKRGADPNTFDINEQFVMHYWCQENTIFRNKMTKKHMKVFNILQKNKANINCLDKVGRTPLLYCLQKCRLTMADVLLNFRACCNIPDIHGKYPLHYVCNFESNIYEQSNKLILKIAKKIYKVFPEVVNFKDNDQRTPVDYAESKNFTNILSLFRC